MNIAVEDLSKVDKKITITANREDLEPHFTKAYKKIRKEVSLPGFRPGTAPLGLIKKRFGKEVEGEEVYKFVDDVYQNKIVPEHQPVGQPKFEAFNWENDELSAVLEIGVKPEIELKPLSEITVDRLIHDVSEEDVDKEVEYTLRNSAEWEETDGPVTEDSKLEVDSQESDKKGKPSSDEVEENVKVDLKDSATEPIRDTLIGKNKGDIALVNYGDKKNPHFYNLTIKKIENPKIEEVSDEWVKKISNDQLNTVDEYRARVKSQVQNYYDKTSADMAKNMVVDELLKAHDFEVPKVMVDAIVEESFKRMQQQYGEGFKGDINDPEFRENAEKRAIQEAKWMFISEEIREKAENLELTKEDVEAFYEKKAAEFNVPADMLKQYYASNQEQMQQAFHEMRDEKLFNYILDEVSSNELNRDDYQNKYAKKD